MLRGNIWSRSSRRAASRRPMSRPAPVGVSGRTSDAYRLSRWYLIIMLLTTLDVTNYLNHGSQIRYAIVLPAVLSVLLTRLRAPSTLIRRPNSGDLALFALFVWGLAGSVYAVTALHVPDAMNTAFVPMAVAFLYLLDLEELSDHEVGRILGAVALIGAVYIALNAFVNAHLVASLAQYRQYRNALLCFVGMGLAAAIVQRRRLRLAVLLLLTAVIFATYPSGTFVLCAVALLATWWLTAARSSVLRPYVLALVVLAVVAVALANFSSGVRATSVYFQLVGKDNNNLTRLALWKSGIQDFLHSPIIGTSFTGGADTTTYRFLGARALTLPYHNDYVLFLANGGLLGFGLLISFILMTEFSVLRRYRELRTSDPNRAALLRVLLVGFNVFFAAAAFNPEFTGSARTATIFSIYGLMMLVAAPLPTHRLALDERAGVERQSRTALLAKRGWS